MFLTTSLTGTKGNFRGRVVCLQWSIAICPDQTRRHPVRILTIRRQYWEKLESEKMLISPLSYYNEFGRKILK